jgi:peptide/nickel transport system substrate-binding protein
MKKFLISLLVLAMVVTLGFMSIGCIDEAIEDEAVEDEAVEDEAVEDEAIEDEAVEDEAVEDEAMTFKEEIVASHYIDPPTLDPIAWGPGGGDLSYFHLFYDNLIKFKNDEFLPMLAESFEVSDDNLSMVFNLREGIKFHDGTDFNAEAAKWNLDRARSAENSRYLSVLESIEDIIVKDDYTLEIKLNIPDPGIMGLLCMSPGSMVSPTAAEELGEDLNIQCVGTGPYIFTELVGGEYLAGTRNPDYWVVDDDGIRLPYSDKVKVRFITDSTTTMIGLKSGDIDISVTMDPSLIQEANETDGLSYILNGFGSGKHLTLNTTREPLSNEKLRQAISCMIDRETLNDLICGEYGIVGTTTIAKGDWAFNPDLETPYSYNPELAEQLLEEAGYPDGHGLDLTLSVINRDPDVRIAEFIQASLADFGVNLDVEILERQAWVEKVVQGGNFDMGTLQGDSPRSDPKTIFDTFYGRNATANRSGYVNEELYDLIDEAGTIYDMEKRYELYSEAQQILIDSCAYIYLFITDGAFIIRDNVISLPYENVRWRLSEAKVLAE